MANKTQNKDLNRLLKKATQQGWRIKRNNRGGHFKCYSPDNKTIVVLSSTTNSKSAVHNAKSHFLAGGLKLYQK